MRIALLAQLLLTVPSISQADATTAIRAGVWREAVHISLSNPDGKMIPQTNKTQRVSQSSDCFTADDVEDPASFFFTDAHDACDGLIATASNGVIKIWGSCTFNGTPFVAVGHGLYTSQRYDETINLSAFIKGHRVAAEGTIAGEYLHDCP